MAPQYVPVSHPYTGSTSNSLVAPSQQPQQLQPQNNPFSFPSYPGGNSNVVVPVFGNNYVRQQPQPTSIVQQTGYAPRTPQPMYADNRYNHHSQSPPLKYEPSSTNPNNSYQPPTTNTSAYQGDNSNKHGIPANPASAIGEDFGTEVDTLMKAIQAKEQSLKPQPSFEKTRPVVGIARPSYSGNVPPSYDTYTSTQERNYSFTQKTFPSHSENSEKGTKKKKYECHIGKCTKSFSQKTHLEIHERAHTGVKPYRCTHAGCDRTFSQHGNLRTHLRRHTGEKPYSCEICQRTFAQKGNVRAHKVVHSQSKPFICHLDNCRKEFTQRGNLKSHQNKFHIGTIRALTAKFASYQYADNVSQADRDLWAYFAELYKNSNKGIKGRGKDRKVHSITENINSSHLPNAPSHGGFNSAVHGRSESIIARSGGPRYEMYSSYDADDARSHSESCSYGSNSSCYDDVASDSFEEVGKTDAAYDRRMY
ncbi:hypothetical protein PVAG01_02463 [Phlyctema vagabunda]|uniref:C2H2-type domain-containing protein n=1 Tax=Phlyctema vagabunda TaxID=108571 RepID=A0ABR4PQP7_9HELO